MKRALILVDLQNDFMPTGALPVPYGNEVIPIANQVQMYFDLIVATQDWHPSNHKSFAMNHSNHKPGDIIKLFGLPQVLWPAHCIQHTAGAKFVSGLNISRVQKVFQKGTDWEVDSYSGFFDNGHRKKTGLDEYLKYNHVKEVYILGVATEYCVKYSALDAQQLGYKVFVIENACRGVNLQANDVENAITEMKMVGITILNSEDIAKRF